jgi:hypothetical protein
VCRSNLKRTPLRKKKSTLRFSQRHAGETYLSVAEVEQYIRTYLPSVGYSFCNRVHVRAEAGQDKAIASRLHAEPPTYGACRASGECPQWVIPDISCHPFERVWL